MCMTFASRTRESGIIASYSAFRAPAKCCEIFAVLSRNIQTQAAPRQQMYLMSLYAHRVFVRERVSVCAAYTGV